MKRREFIAGALALLSRRSGAALKEGVAELGSWAVSQINRAAIQSATGGLMAYERRAGSRARTCSSKAVFHRMGWELRRVG